MEKRKNRIILYVLIIVMLAIFVVGVTYAFLSLSKENSTAINGTYANVDIDVKVEKVVGSNKLIPMDDDNLATAISSENECVTNSGYDACHIYKVTVSNEGSVDVDVNSKIKFVLNDIANLKWQEISDVDDVGTIDNTEATNGYLPTLASSSDTAWRIDDTISKDDEKEYYVVVWVSNLTVAQNEQDKGSYEGTITFSTLSGEVTSTFKP